MLKVFQTLVRGMAAAAEEEVRDRHALPLLDQQIREAAAGIEAARRAYALATAQDAAEAKRLETVLACLADLETRALAALAAGREDLASDAAEAIAELEADRDAGRKAREAFAAEIGRIRRRVLEGERRLAALERGRRIARARAAARRLGTGATAPSGEGALADAEATLRRLQDTQGEAEAAEDALAALDAETRAAGVAETLAQNGFGPPVRPGRADVLARLKARLAAEASSDLPS
ncbi:PspA/IM30 family protein [Prosthecomicrobium sp. N25]|uniref:PspA/IM30 family protein n=1 Tax=Prosthecomicrobium sp. N25 TaxID=3129254 RepID=UPI003076F21E